MRIPHFLLTTAIAFLLPACSHLPEMPEDVLDTVTVVQHIKCEFREAALSDPAFYPFLETWNSLFILTLETDEKGTLTANVGLTHPIIPTIFSLPLTGELSQDVKRTEKIQFAESVPDTVKDAKILRCPEPRYAPLQGKLGFADLFARAYLSTVKASIETSQYDYTLDFTIVKNATAAPKWTMIPLRGRDVLEAGFKWNANRERSHTLQLTMKPPDKKETCKHLPEFFAVYKKCPTVVATLDEVRKAHPDFLTKEEAERLRKRLEKENRPTTFRMKTLATPTRKGVAPDALRDLESGSARSLIDDVRRRVERLDRPLQ